MSTDDPAATPTRRALTLARTLLEAFHAERREGRIVHVARLDGRSLVGHLNALAAIERDVADGVSGPDDLGPTR